MRGFYGGGHGFTPTALKFQTDRSTTPAFGIHPLLDRAQLVQEGKRTGLPGCNGMGKSSLLRALTGELDLDDCLIHHRDRLTLALVEEEPTLPPAATLRESLVIRRHLEHHTDDREHRRIDARRATQGQPETGNAAMGTSIMPIEKATSTSAGRDHDASARARSADR